jgi:hypothetical protein
MSWRVTMVEVVYRCSDCGTARTVLVKQPNNAVSVGALCTCGGLLGIDFVSYTVKGPLPCRFWSAEGDPLHRVTKGQPSAVDPSDVETAASMGIKLATEPQGGPNEGNDDGNLPWN